MKPIIETEATKNLSFLLSVTQETALTLAVWTHAEIRQQYIHVAIDVFRLRNDYA